MKLKNIFLRALLQAKSPRVCSTSLTLSREYHDRSNSQEDKYWRYSRVTAAAAISLGSVLIGGAITDSIENKQPIKQASPPKKDTTEQDGTVDAGAKVPGLPTYTAEEVSQHNSKESFWVTFRHGVYDVTSFLPSHPGGEQIYNAAGLSIEPFWNVYGMHKTPEVLKLLESFRIGNLHDDDIVDHSDEELWVKEPLRDKRLIVKTARPFNAEIPPKYQVEHFDTPNELFYVRQHMPVPELDARTHKLTVTVVRGDGAVTTTSFSLDELVDKFPKVSVRAALMCAGNRRSEMDKVKPVKGISWSTGAISNAVWGGVSLREVLLHCGVDENDMDGKHVVLTGADVDATGTNFSTSIPLHMAMSHNSRALLATHMNGVELPLDHGYPLRVVVPGAPAVRSVKWLESITVSTSESGSHWHQKDYRGFNPSRTWETADFSTAPPVYSLPVTSAVCYPEDGATVTTSDGKLQIRGYAYSGGGAKILRVDVSCDRGATWREAELTGDAAPPHAHYAWTLWSLHVPAHHRPQMEIWVKATDSNFNTQPEQFDGIWNIRGILSNAYHKIKVNLVHE